MVDADIRVVSIAQIEASGGGTAEALDRYVDIAQESLLGHSLETWTLYLDRIDRRNVRLVYRDDRLAGGLAFYRMHHVFGGREVSAAGISGVAIDPACRGSDVCANLLRDTLRELGEEGVAIASLYASTQHLYRGVGFEQAGSRTEYVLPLRSLPRPDRSLSCTRREPPPLASVRHAHRVWAENNSGNLIRTDGLWDRLFRPYDGLRCVTYLFGDPEQPEGYVILKQAGRQSGLPAELVATDYAVNTPAALDRLMALLHDHRSMFDRFRWFGGPQDPLLASASELWMEVQETLRWMIRVLDMKTAFSSRGYPSTLNGEVHLEIRDDLLPSNAGLWRFTWNHGRLSIERSSPNDSAASNDSFPSNRIRTDARWLAPLYSGFLTASQLRRLGKLEGGDSAAVAVLDAAFAGPSPWLSEIF